MIKLRIRVVRSRSYQCDIAGCRNRTKYLITKRDDIASHPVHLCASCIDGIKALYDELIAAEVKEAPVPAVTVHEGDVINVGDVTINTVRTEAEIAPAAEDAGEPADAPEVPEAPAAEKKPARRRKS